MRIFTLILLFFLPFTCLAQWLQQSSPVVGPLNDVYCHTENFVVAVGNYGVILRTTDGGNTWIEKTSGTSNNLYAVQFASTSVCYAAGNNGTVLKSTDAGQSWSTLATGTVNDLTGLSVIDENTVVVSGANGTILKSTDAGLTFSSLNSSTTAHVKKIQFVNGLVGYAIAAQLLKTSDGGLNWMSMGSSSFSTFHFVDEQSGFLADETGMISKTTDGGVTADVFSLVYGNVLDMTVAGSDKLWIADDSQTLCGCPGHCISKYNLAPNASPQLESDCGVDGQAVFSAIAFASETVGYAVNDYGHIFKNPTGLMLSTGNTDLKTGITMFPNPATTNLSLTFSKMPSTAISLTITDVYGKNVIGKTFSTAANLSLDTSSLSSGMYVITLEYDNLQEQFKLLIR